MSKKLVIAEKKSVAEHIAKALGISMSEGSSEYFENGEYILSWASGHLLELKNPEDIDTNAEDHLYDALRYGIMSRPRFSIFDYDPNVNQTSRMPVADATFGY